MWQTWRWVFECYLVYLTCPLPHCFYNNRMKDHNELGMHSSGVHDWHTLQARLLSHDIMSSPIRLPCITSMLFRDITYQTQRPQCTASQKGTQNTHVLFTSTWPILRPAPLQQVETARFCIVSSSVDCYWSKSLCSEGYLVWCAVQPWNQGHGHTILLGFFMLHRVLVHAKIL